ncbi:MAG: CHAT domain-containing protein [Deltaproteobacteria bacterium]|nr:CHAT domain-containing protein [Deltaproteobacteria bacterium]
MRSSLQWPRFCSLFLILVFLQGGCRDSERSRENPQGTTEPCPLGAFKAVEPIVSTVINERELSEALSPSARELGQGETHRIIVDLELEHAVQLRVEQEGADVALVLRGPGGEVRLSMDRPTGGRGFEEITIWAQTAGRYAVDIVNLNSPGRYRLASLSGPRPALDADRWKARAEKSFMAGRRAEKLPGVACGERALSSYEKALEAWSEASDYRGVAVSKARQGEVLFHLGHRDEAREILVSALSGLEEATELGRASEVHNLLGVLAAGQGELDEANRHYQRADYLGELSGNEEARVHALGNFAMLSFYRGDADRAVESLKKQRHRWKELGRPEEEIASLNRLGEVYLKAGERAIASSYLREALELARSRGARMGEAGALARLGKAELEVGDKTAARDLMEQARDLYAGRAGTAFELASVLNDLGRVELNSRNFRNAEENFLQAEELYRGLDPPALQDAAIASMHRAWTLEGAGRQKMALDLYRQALDDFSTVDDRDGEASASYGMAVTLLSLDLLPEALLSINHAIRWVEHRRNRFTNWRRQSFYLASKHRYFSLKVEILMRLHEEDPSAGHDVNALLASEAGRARALLDLLLQGRELVLPKTDPELLTRRAQAWSRARQFGAILEEGLQGRRSSAEKPGELQRRLQEVLAELDGLETQLRQADPHYAFLTMPDRLSLAEFQQVHVDPGTRLLIYSLGEEHSWSWLIERERVQSFLLPGQAELEGRARRIHETMSSGRNRRGPDAAGDDLRELGHSLLLPLMEVEPGGHIVFVPDGALHYVPFGALSLPVGSGVKTRLGGPLISHFDVSILPSLASLAEIRKFSQGRPKPPKSLALFGDPIYSLKDERVIRRKPGGNHLPKVREPQQRAPVAVASFKDVPVRSETRTGDLIGAPELSGFSRLPHAADEVETILRLLPESDSFAAVGFEATLSAFQRVNFGRYRWLHLAGHGVLDEKNPRLSGLVLSQREPSGQPIAGILRLQEIYALHLPVELVVLSACSTGLGEEIRGEGLVGLTHGFFYAGAQRVVVSLWDVQDHATAELMKSFYRSMIEDGLVPSAALAAAQNDIRSRPGWQSPYFWAGFVLQGDWR